MKKEKKSREIKRTDEKKEKRGRAKQNADERKEKKREGGERGRRAEGQYNSKSNLKRIKRESEHDTNGKK